MINNLRIRDRVWEMNESSKKYIMGVVNLTPDSFSDGGHWEKGFSQKIASIVSQVDILDIGGESTRPGASPVSAAEEQRRVLPGLEWIRNQYPELPISIDTYRVETAQKAVLAGADMINDISAGDASNNEMLHLAMELSVPVVLMHKRGNPQTMQDEVNYLDVKKEIFEYFKSKLEFLDSISFPRDQVVLDPGIGFSKYLEHNVDLVGNLDYFHPLKRPILLGASRKKMVGELTDKFTENRLYGSIAVHLAGVSTGAHILRVHDVIAMRAALEVYTACIASRV